MSRAALAAVAVAVLAVAPVLAVVPREGGGPPYDPYSLVRLIDHAVTLLVSGDYEAARAAVELALNATPPGDAGLAHRRLYDALSRLIDLEERAARAGPGESAALAAEAWRLRDELEAALRLYRVYLSPQDPVLAHLASLRLRGLAEILSAEVERLYTSLASRAAGGALEVEPVDAVVGGRLVLRLYGAPEGAAVNVTVYIQGVPVAGYAGVLEDRTLAVPLPGAGELAEAGVQPGLSNPYVAVVRAEYAGARLYGVASGVARAYRPPVLVTPPAAVLPGEPVRVTVESGALVELEGFVELRVSGSTVARVNVTVPPRSSVEATLEPRESPPPGSYYLLYAEFEPRGPYVGSRHTALVPVVPRGDVEAAVPPVIVGPPFRLGLTVSPEANVTVYVFVDGRLAGVVESGGGGASAPVPGPLLAAVYNVTLRAWDGYANYTIYTGEVVAVNYLGVAAAAALASLAAGAASPGSWGPLEPAARAIAGALASRGRGRGRPDEMRLLYRRLLGLLAPLAGPPEPWETLREYASRAEARLPPEAAAALREFVAEYEAHLYSPRPGDARRARRALESLESGVAGAG